MTYPEAITYVSEARRFGMKLGLEPMQRVAARMGNPQDKLRFIHLAGTNGKGSTAAFCESCLRAAGHRVGLYTSPHLISIRERIQIDREPVSETVFAEGMAAVREAVEACADLEPTFFEIMTALALWVFERGEVDWVVWETGLGGRLDATNIVQPRVCIITNIALDHTEYLGTTLGQIAREKAGIIKAGVPVVSGVGAGEAGDIVASRARELGAPLVLVEEKVPAENIGVRGPGQLAKLAGRDYALGLLGAHQVANAACAVAALRALAPDFTFSDEAIERGLQSARWAGRFEIVSETPPIVVDGAHNSEAMGKLLETWREFLMARGMGQEPARLAFASVADKNISEMARLLRPGFDEVALIRLQNERSSDPAALAEYFDGATCRVFRSVAEFWSNRQTLSSPRPLLITGSLFLVGEILAQVRGGENEFVLNERLDTLKSPRKGCL
jgi:dihydrofolate synthase/folylpolyglutamate synthase